MWREMPDMPLGISNRQHDIWLPLIAIADLAGEEWGAVARKACIMLSAEQTEQDTEAGQSLRLLRDIRLAFDQDGRTVSHGSRRRSRHPCVDRNCSGVCFVR